MRALLTALCGAALAATAAFTAPGADVPARVPPDACRPPLDDSAAAPTTAERAACWCLADEYRRVAEAAGAERISHAAARAADAYERAAPPESSWVGAGWRSGDRIAVALGDGATCTTVVR